MKVYNSESVTLILLTLPITEARAEDVFFEFEPAKEAYTTTVGADGSIVRNATNNKLFNWKCHLLSSSIHNLELSALHAADRADSAGAGVGALLCEHTAGGTLIASAAAWITKAPPFQFGSECKTVTWEGQCECGPLTVNLGGI